MTRLDPRLWKVLVAGAAFAVSVGCAHPGTPPAAGRAAADMSARAADAERALVAPKAALGQVDIGDGLLELTPEKVEAKARDRAKAWQPDAELRFVGWGVAKWELLSTVYHVFYSPKANEVLVVDTFLREKWQKAHVYDHQVVTTPAKALQPLQQYRIDGHRALALSKKYFWVGKPVSIVTLSRPVKLPFAFWGVVADRTVVLVHAHTGQSLSPRGFDPFPKEWMVSR